MGIIHSEERNGYRIEIALDPDPQDPREWDNLGTMVCRHRRYDLGDKGAEMPEMEEVTSDWVALQLHLYDHSGITMRTTPFTDVDSQGWDSGQVGMVYASPKRIREEYKLKEADPISPEIATEVREVLEQEVKTYDQYLRGNCWGYRVIEVDTGTVRDACWGFYQNESPDAQDSHVLAEARDAADALPKGGEITTRKIADRYDYKHDEPAMTLTSYLLGCAKHEARRAGLWIQTRHPKDLPFATVQKLIEIEERDEKPE